MEEERSINITEKVITQKDLLNIYKFINSEFEKIHNPTYGDDFHIEIRCDDGTAYKSSTPDLLSSGGIIDIKAIKSIYFYFTENSGKKFIRVSLSCDGYLNTISISGKEPSWVGDTFLRMEELVRSIKQQNTFVKKHKSILEWALTIVIGISYVKILDLILNIINPKPSQNLVNLKDNPVIQLVSILQKEIHFLDAVAYFFAFMFGSFISWRLVHKLISLWPTLEFEFRPESSDIAKKRRSYLKTAALIVFLPIVINILSSYIIKISGNG